MSFKSTLIEKSERRTNHLKRRVKCTVARLQNSSPGEPYDFQSVLKLYN